MGGVRGVAMNATGQWEEGLEHGHGQCVTADGAAYDGQWEGGVRCGQGKVSRGDGYQYSGQWLDNQPHGHGTAFH
ncbi:TPA: hypothetical protein ACH3X1_000927 [Trebouxia sp. C0004]